MINLLKRWFSSASDFDPKRRCADCGSPLYRDAIEKERERACPNLDCPAKIRGLLERWCSREAMDLPIGVELRALLVERGLVRDVADLYKLKLRELVKFPTLDAAKAAALMEALAENRRREPWRVLFGLGIPEVTPAAAQALVSALGSVDAVFAASAERLSQNASVSEEVARSIVHWHGDSFNRRILRKLNRRGIDLQKRA